MRRFLLKFGLGLFALVLSMTSSATAQTSQWVFVGPDGKLQYKILPNDNNPSTINGDRIMDFSSAGYMGGGVGLPDLPVRQSISPSGGDDTSAIQAAINEVASLAPDANGFRGAVLLAPGTFNLSGTLNITASGVVLRGSGSDTNGTAINLTGSSHTFIRLAGTGSWSQSGAVPITSSYVPSGTDTFTVSSTAGFAVGDAVIVERPVTSNWVHFMDMDTLVRNGQPQTWLGTSTRIRSDRAIKAILGDQVTLDIPLSDSFDSTFLDPPGGRLSRYTFPGRISQVGVESLRVIAPPGTPQSPTGFKLLSIDAVIDGWVKDIFGQDLRNGLSVGDTAKRITLDRVTLHHTIPSITAAKPGDFGISGTQTLLMRSKSTNAAGVYYALTQSTDVGPIVFLDFEATGGIAVEPHQRWATGLLVDRANVAGSINLMNRGIFGSGHGWTIGWSVAWNSMANTFIVQRPPGSQNWSIGGRGNIRDQPRPGRSTNEPRGAFDSHGTPVAPSSLYLAQLCERLGPSALTNIGYDSSNCVGFALSATPNSQTVTAGGSTSYTAAVTPSQGFNSTVNLSVSGLPDGATASFNPASISDGSGSSTLTVSTSSSTPAGTYTLKIEATSGSFARSSEATLVINPSETLPPGWSDLDLGTTGVAGSATFSGGTFTVKGSGEDIWDSADGFNYLFQSLTGNTIITARVAGQKNTDPWAKSGVMIRETTAVDSSMFDNVSIRRVAGMKIEEVTTAPQSP